MKTPLEYADQAMRFADYFSDAVRGGNKERAVDFADCLAAIAAEAASAITQRPEEIAVTTTQEPPLAVRFPAGSDLLAWYRRHAGETGVSVNAALIRGLQRHRAAVEDAAALAREGAQ